MLCFACNLSCKACCTFGNTDSTSSLVSNLLHTLYRIGLAFVLCKALAQNTMAHSRPSQFHVKHTAASSFALVLCTVAAVFTCTEHHVFWGQGHMSNRTLAHFTKLPDSLKPFYQSHSVWLLPTHLHHASIHCL